MKRIVIGICHAIVILRVVGVPFCEGEGIAYSYKISDRETILVEMINNTDGDIVIMGGRGDSLVKLGIAYIDSKSTNVILRHCGRNQGMFEMPDLIFLPKKYSRRFIFKIKDFEVDSKIVQLRIGLAYLNYNEFSKRYKSDSNDMVWAESMHDLVFDEAMVSQRKLSYGFGLGLGGAERLKLGD